MPTSEGHSPNTSLKGFLILYSSTRRSVHSRYESPLQVAVMPSSVRQFQYTSNALKKGYNEDVSSAYSLGDAVLLHDVLTSDKTFLPRKSF